MMNRLTKYDNVKKKKIKDIYLDHTKYVINVSSDGKKVYVSGAGPTITVVDAVNFRTKKVVWLPGDTVFSALRALNRPPL
jgi:DNA-binding beta-propeller fold protein YncE